MSIDAENEGSIELVAFHCSSCSTHFFLTARGSSLAFCPICKDLTRAVGTGWDVIDIGDDLGADSVPALSRFGGGFSRDDL